MNTWATVLDVGGATTDLHSVTVGSPDQVARPHDFTRAKGQAHG